MRKMQIFEFPEGIFWQFSEKFKNFLSRFPVSFFETFFLHGLHLKTQLIKNPNQIESSHYYFGGKIFWVKTVIG